MKAMTTGSDVTSEAAISGAHCTAASPMKALTSPGGRVCRSGPVRVRAKMRSFHPRMKANSPAATRPGAEMGSTIEWMIPYSNGEKTWTYQQIEKPKLADMFIVLRRAAYAYHEPRYEAEAQRVQQADPENSRFNLLFPKPSF